MTGKGLRAKQSMAGHGREGLECMSGQDKAEQIRAGKGLSARQSRA